MPLTTYVAGDVLTAASLNNNFTFAAANPPGGLELISTTTVGSAVATVTVSGAFSSTYDNYKITLSGGTSSVNDENVSLRLGATTTGYFAAMVGATYAASSSIVANNNTSGFLRAGQLFTNGLVMNIDLIGPNLAKRTYIMGTELAESSARSLVGYQNSTTQFTAFTLIVGNGTITGGEIRVYGYKN